MIGVGVSFVVFLLAFIAVGLASTLKARAGTEDFLLAGRTIPPWMTALSAAATNNSGFMFIGMIGLTYATGLSSLWLQAGLITGDLLASLKIYPAVRRRSGERGIFSYSGLLARWHGPEMKLVRIVSALLILAFLGVYAAAQFRAGGKALEVLFGWPQYLGAVIGAGIVLSYCMTGGLRASIWTDAVQSIVMIFAVSLLLFAAFAHLGGVGAFAEAAQNVAPGYLHLFPPDQLFGPFFGPLLFVAGWVAGGLGVAGQPHIMVRFMAMDSANSMARVRLWYYSWNVAFSTLVILCGMAARIILPDMSDFDPELALPTLSLEVLPTIFTGFVLAGLFAATISTADSQIISCTTVLTHDLTPEHQRTVLLTRLGTLFIAMSALAIALYGAGSVFSLVLVAWSALASAFFPLMLVHVLGGRPSQNTALAMMAGGLGVMLAWWGSGLGDQSYEVLPGAAAGLAIYGLSLLAPGPRRGLAQRTEA